jgi:MYXO-CTERM domain-containing protein
MPTFRRALPLAILLAVSCAPPDTGVGEEAIVNGVRETGHPEVVAVYWSASPTAGGLCTGTVIGPYAVLTAKHCVFEEIAPGTHRAVPASDFVVVVGHDLDSMSGITSVHRVLEVRTTPGSDIDADVMNGADIAILLLDDDIGVAARGYATSGPALGEPMTIVGFGRTSSGSDAAGQKYRGTTSVSRRGMYLIESDGGSWTCQGDSGGPAIDSAGRVTGITSFGFGDCRLPYSYFTRVAAYAPLISGALAFVPPCSPDVEVCNDVDDDCDGMTDEIGCAELGEPCTTSADCIRASCQDVGGSRICVEACFPDDPSVGCSAGRHCEVTSCGQGRCVTGGPGAGANGTECTSDLECASGHCADVGGIFRCGLQCFVDGIPCPFGEVCEIPAAAGCGACIPAELSSRPRPFGTACDADAQCESGDCAAELFCTRACVAHGDCGTGYHCASAACATGSPVAEGGACGFDDDCEDGLACVASVCSTSGGPMTGGGCSVTAAPSPAALLAPLLALALLALRRR